MASAKEKIFKEISVYLDRIEDLEDGTVEAVLLVEDGEEDYSGEIHLSANFLPEDAGEGDYLTIKISPVEDEISEDGKIFVNLKQIENYDDGAADAVLLLEDGEEIYLPANFLPEDTETGDTLTIEIFRDEDKTNAALDEARQLLKELE